jgi:hypothetical protein
MGAQRMKHIQNISVAKASTNDGGLGNLGLVSYIAGVVFFLKQWF